MIAADTSGDERAAAWREAVARSAPADVVEAEAAPRDHREFFYRLVNIENFANTLPLAAEHAETVLRDAEVLWTHGAGGRYTDATWFDYSSEALYERCERIYWDKLVAPYQPLDEIPDRDTVVFLQTTYALGALIDGAWLHRLGNLGHRERPSDPMLFSIYADEMGRGDLTKNHITLIHRVLRSLGIDVPHIFAVTFGLGTACLAIAACLLLPSYYVNPRVGEAYVLVAFTIVVMGGMGSIPGAIAGGLVVGVIESLSGLYLGESLGQLGIFILFILVLLFRPAGFFGARA